MSDKAPPPVIIPAWLDDLGLDLAPFRLYCRMARRAGKRGLCNERVTRMAQGCRLSRAAAFSALALLKQLGLVVPVEQPLGKAATYRVRKPDDPSTTRTGTRPPHGRDQSTTRTGTRPPGGRRRSTSEGVPARITHGVCVPSGPEAEAEAPTAGLTADRALLLLQDASEGRFRATKAPARAVKVVADYPDEAVWVLIGEWIGAGGEAWRKTWDARSVKAEDFSAWLDAAQRWDADGRPSLDGDDDVSPYHDD